MIGISEGARAILREMTGANQRRKWSRGTRNCWTAGTEVTAPLRELLDAGLIISEGLLRPETIKYVATTDGMRAAGLGPREIERCCAVAVRVAS